MVAQRRKERRCELRRHHWSVRHDGDETNGVRGSECRVQEAIAPAQIERYRSGHRAPGMLVPASSYGLQHRQRHESSTFLSPPAHSLLSIVATAFVSLERKHKATCLVLSSRVHI